MLAAWLVDILIFPSHYLPASSYLSITQSVSALPVVSGFTPQLYIYDFGLAILIVLVLTIIIIKIIIELQAQTQGKAVAGAGLVNVGHVVGVDVGP